MTRTVEFKNSFLIITFNTKFVFAFEKSNWHLLIYLGYLKIIWSLKELF